MKQLGLGVLNFESARKRLPAANSGISSTGGGAQKWWVLINNHHFRGGITAP